MPPLQATSMALIKLYLKKMTADGTPSLTKKKVQVKKIDKILKNSAIGQNNIDTHLIRSLFNIYIANLFMLCSCESKMPGRHRSGDIILNKCQHISQLIYVISA